MQNRRRARAIAIAKTENAAAITFRLFVAAIGVTATIMVISKLF